jgi:hypothetical protein
VVENIPDGVECSPSRFLMPKNNFAGSGGWVAKGRKDMSANPAVLKGDTHRRKRAIELWEQRVQTLTEAATGGKSQTTTGTTASPSNTPTKKSTG